jgi:hypothetical protein
MAVDCQAREHRIGTMNSVYWPACKQGATPLAGGERTVRQHRASDRLGEGGPGVNDPGDRQRAGAQHCRSRSCRRLCNLFA